VGRDAPPRRNCSSVSVWGVRPSESSLHSSC
jgi:hypothetical protein